ncbi:DinB family protein [Salegentibacter chungangensis]|uniref:DinB family protein n=1 Tax=Salegentibacter chungangensis TaxID=1335724 RepID=A0ABW3NTX5_9FLAO
MDIKDFFLQELQQEAALTEKFLKRIPEDKLDWKPHQKSMSFRELANHLAEIPSWITGTMEMEELDMEGYKAPDFGSIEEILQTLKNNVQEAEAALNKPDEEYQKNWKMTQNGETLMEMPRFNVLQAMVMNQFPHHRAQLGVYLRLNDLSVPATYGPSADEN